VNSFFSSESLSSTEIQHRHTFSTHNHPFQPTIPFGPLPLIFGASGPLPQAAVSAHPRVQVPTATRFHSISPILTSQPSSPPTTICIDPLPSSSIPISTHYSSFGPTTTCLDYHRQLFLGPGSFKFSVFFLFFRGLIVFFFKFNLDYKIHLLTCFNLRPPFRPTMTV
jgi:hypothetical protein